MQNRDLNTQKKTVAVDFAMKHANAAGQYPTRSSISTMIEAIIGNMKYDEYREQGWQRRLGL